MTINMELIEAAVKSDHFSQAAYTGRIQQTEHIVITGPDGIPIEKDFSFFITWDTISSVLELVRKRARLEP